MIKIKNFMFFLISILVILMIVINIDTLSSRFKDILRIHPELVIKPGNEYQKDDSFLFVKQVDSYTPYNYEELKNIFYSVLNQGWNEFTFYCPVEYQECLNDVADISYDKLLLSNINNFVHPYNSYTSIKTLFDETGEITIKVTHLYSNEEIDRIDKDIDLLIENVVKDSMSDKEKILALHDYIINNTKYDIERANSETNSSEYDSARILGVLYDHYAICSGYADLMGVILEKLNIPNYKISSETHVWNALYLDNEWWHLDLTWDDPISTSGKDILDHSYFLIDSKTLRELDVGIKDHIYDKDIYMEVN